MELWWVMYRCLKQFIHHKVSIPEFLRRAYGDKNQRFATKLDPMKSNSPIIYDTEGLWIWWQKQIELQTKTMQRR